MGSNRTIDKKQQKTKISLELFNIDKSEIKEVLDSYKIRKELDMNANVAIKYMKRNFEDNKKYFVLDYFACLYMEKLLERNKS